MTGFWRGMPVFVTGHTGFKGTWLCHVLSALGAEVHGYSIDVPTEPSMFDATGAASLVATDGRGDIRSLGALRAALAESGARVVFHLAAQPLVLAGYRDPVQTFDTNVMGTVNVLEAARSQPTVASVVVVTTDKCYAASPSGAPHREDDRLGGADPYSASKAAAELVTAAYRASYFGDGPRVASTRAGNVIGGGDWGADRLVPDCIRAFAASAPVVLRRPQAVRPWQHVLEPLAGYLALAEHLAGPAGGAIAGAWNFGPDDTGDATVHRVATALAAGWGAGAQVEVAPDASDLHETAVLRLDSALASAELGWRPRWGLDAALGRTLDWYRAHAQGADVAALTRAQIDEYLTSA